jgi:hypothetical protein
VRLTIILAPPLHICKKSLRILLVIIKENHTGLKVSGGTSYSRIRSEKRILNRRAMGSEEIPK